MRLVAAKILRTSSFSRKNLVLIKTSKTLNVDPRYLIVCTSVYVSEPNMILVRAQTRFGSESKSDLGPSPGHDGTLTKCIQALYTRGLPSWIDIPGRRSHSIMYLVHIHTHTHTHIYNTETMSIIYGNTHTHTHTHTHMRGVYYNVHGFILCCCCY